MLHAAHISFFSDPHGRRPGELLEAWPSLVDVAEAAAAGPTRVTVIQACSHRERIEHNGIPYHFLPFGHRRSTPSGRAEFHELLRRIAPDVLHVHGLGFPQQLLALARAMPGMPILVQDHASGPPRIWRRPAWRRGLAVVRGFAFCSRAQARPFVELGIIPRQATVFEIPESTSRFVPGDRDEARRSTGIDGNPALLWVGHLDGNKDPLTVLDGLSFAVSRLPGLQLWCCFGKATLMREMQARIDGDPMLAGRVNLIGQVPHERIELLMRAADIFVLGSHREGSGYSLIEALACGLPPAVTDIPSFRALTGEGTVGRLWPCDDPVALGEAIVAVASRPRHALRAQARAHFDAQLSFAALGRKLGAAYQQLLAEHGAG